MAIQFPITTARLLIWPMSLDDADGLLAVYGDLETMQYLTPDVPQDLAGARERVAAKIELYERDGQLSLWTVMHRVDGQIVGDVGLQREDYGDGPVIGLGGRGNRSFWRQGFGVEAAIATIEVGFAQLDLDEIWAETAPGNQAAQALLHRLGMRPVGLGERGWPTYAITREQWWALRRPPRPR
jgi:[ribosomal protein S5]-alanine N-acetyltransferase